MEKLKLKFAIVRDLVGRNPARIGLQAKLQTLIDQYNTGSLDVERLFEELMAFVGELNEEENRHVREGLSEAEELPIFDILTRPEPKLTKAKELKVKTVVRELLAELKQEKLVLGWQTKEAGRSGVRDAINSIFDDNLPEAYDGPLLQDKAFRTYQFVFERFALGEIRVQRRQQARQPNIRMTPETVEIQ